jgi:hypothetical protein
LRAPARWAGVTLLAAVLLATGGCAGSPDGGGAPTAADRSVASDAGAATAAPLRAAVLPKSLPLRVQIPAVGLDSGVDSGLLELGLQADGSLEVPPDGASAGWYTGAPTPGELGPAIIAAHVDWEGEPGVFYDLRDVRPGNEVEVTREDGAIAVFRVSRVEQFPKGAFPTDVVYGDIDHAGLRLITCGGSFDREARSYEDNIVVFAELLTTRPV